MLHTIEPEQVHYGEELILEDSNTLDYFNKFIRGFIHKHNNHLTISLGYSSLITGSTREIKTLQQAQRISECAEKAVELNNEANSCLIPTSPNLETFDLLEFIATKSAQIQEPLQQRNITLLQSIQPPQVKVHADKEWLNRIIDEILKNAIEASTPESSELHFDVVHVPFDHLGDTSRIEIVISDDGAGINEEDLKSVFEPFFSKKGHEHLGIGLNNAGILTYKLGGKLGIASSPKGTTVIISLPAE